MAKSIVSESSFRIAEAGGHYEDDEVYSLSPNQSVEELQSGRSRTADMAIDVLCAVLSLGIAVIFALTRFFSESSEDAESMAYDQVRADDDNSSDNAMIALGGMGLLSLAILAGLIVWSFRS